MTYRGQIARASRCFLYTIEKSRMEGSLIFGGGGEKNKNKHDAELFPFDAPFNLSSIIACRHPMVHGGITPKINRRQNQNTKSAISGCRKPTTCTLGSSRVNHNCCPPPFKKACRWQRCTAFAARRRGYFVQRPLLTRRD